MRTVIVVFVVSFSSFFAVGQSFITNNQVEYSKEAAISLVDSLYKSIVQKPETFEQLAFELSQDPGSFKNGGRLASKMKLESLEEVFRYNIERLEIGEISKPFETWYGWHIARVISITEDKEYEIQHILIQTEL